MVLVPDELQLTAFIADALRAHDSETASLLRMLKSSLHNTAITQGSPLDEQARMTLYCKEIKQRREAAGIFAANGRPQLAAKEDAEAESIEEFLPKSASREQIIDAAKEMLPNIEKNSPSAKGVLIKLLRNKFGANADGGLIAEIATTMLLEWSNF